jgi:hypothetical protein
MRRSCLFSQFWIFPALAIIPLFGKTAQAQVVLPREMPDAVQDLVAPPSLRINIGSPLQDATSPSPRPDRFQLFRMPAGFITNPVGLDSDDDDPPTDPESATAPSFPGEDRLQLILGQDNPFFDFRYRGDPGGVGYYRLHTQYQLLDSSTSGLCLGLRAATPAGLEADGLAHGPTILSPALAWYQDLGGIASLHGYIGKNLRATNGWTDSLERSIHYGVAVQEPVPGLASGPIGGLHMFIEALGRQRSSPDLVGGRPPFNWEVLPGLHWQMGENWWMSGGLLLPMGASRLETNLWQITCSWRF